MRVFDSSRNTGARVLRISILLVLCFAPVCHQASAAVPGQMEYQGYLRDSSGQPVTGPVNFTFYIYSDSTGGTACWGPESHVGVQVVGGLFDLLLGSSVPIPTACLDGSKRWLETWVAGVPLSPRKPITSSAYAMTAGYVSFGTIETGKSMGVVYQAPADGFVTAFTRALSPWFFSVFWRASHFGLNLWR